MGIHKWHNKYGGRYWRVTEDGIETRDAGYLRTAGDPVTVTKLWEDFGEDISYICAELNVPADMIVAMIPIEARRTRDGRYDPRSVRHEPGYISDEETPRRVSPGLMQTLITTARSMARHYSLVDPDEVDREMLFDPFYSIMLGGAYIAYQIGRYGPDPILIASAYNAGSARKHLGNPWHLQAYGKTRISRYCSWFNDFMFAIDNGFINLDARLPLTRDWLPEPGV